MSFARLCSLFHRRGWPFAVLVAVLAIASSVLFDLPYLATAVFPGVWVALQGDARRCRRALSADAPA